MGVEAYVYKVELFKECYATSFYFFIYQLTLQNRHVYERIKRYGATRFIKHRDHSQYLPSNFKGYVKRFSFILYIKDYVGIPKEEIIAQNFCKHFSSWGYFFITFYALTFFFGCKSIWRFITVLI